MKKALLIIVLMLPAFGTSGECDTELPVGDCPGEPVSAIRMKIVNSDGDVLDSADFQVQYNNGEPSVGGCNGNCEDVPMGTDLLGVFDLEVWAPGYLVKQETVTVEAAEEGGCHPKTEYVVIELEADTTVAALQGVWRVDSFQFGSSILRFDNNGDIIGAILLDRVAQGDGNIYISYNGYIIAGAGGSLYVQDIATSPTRTVDVFSFTATTMNYDIGFDTATMSDDFNTLVGLLSGTGVVYSRLEAIPAALQTN